MIRAGPMRHRVTLQTMTRADVAAPPTWTDWETRFAAVQATPGVELFASAGRQGRVPTIFRLRYLAGVTPGMRLVWNGKVHDIQSAVDQAGLKEELIITAVELVEETP